MDAKIEGNSGFVAIGGRVPKGSCDSVPQNGYWFSLEAGGAWNITSGKFSINYK